MAYTVGLVVCQRSQVRTAFARGCRSSKCSTTLTRNALMNAHVLSGSWRPMGRRRCRGGRRLRPRGRPRTRPTRSMLLTGRCVAISKDSAARIRVVGPTWQTKKQQFSKGHFLAKRYRFLADSAVWLRTVCTKCSIQRAVTPDWSGRVDRAKWANPTYRKGLNH